MEKSISIEDILREKSGIRLDIACGTNCQPGFVGMDIQPLPGVAIVHDLETYPWPLPDECVLTAIASHIVEHICPWKFGFVNWMNEVWRVMKVGGEFAIVTPHGYSPGYLQDPTHCNPCNENTWAYFDPGAYDGALWGFYQAKPWRIKALNWSPETNIEVVLVKRGMDELR